MKDIIDLVLVHESFLSHPPVLIDIGASGEIFPAWKRLAPYSHCITFEADERESCLSKEEKTNWKKFTNYDSLATSESSRQQEFHLTKFPFCSSTLKPNKKSLSDWEFSPLFQVEKTTMVKSTNISEVLKNSGIHYVDWFKSDSQGIDLRLFSSLPNSIRSKVLAVDFEPGIIDAYEGEDKLHHVLSYMDSEPFWVNQMQIKGNKRIRIKELNFSEDQNKLIVQNQRNSPCWCEISYLNTMDADNLKLREHLMAWVFSTILEQFAFALSITKNGAKKFDDQIFEELALESLKSLS